MISELNYGEQPILKIENLTVAYRQGQIEHPVLRNVSLQIRPRETYGLVGESGSGKTTLALAAMRALPRAGRVKEGNIRFADRDLLQASRAEMQQIWGRKIAMVPQDARASLNPSMRLGDQVSELLCQHLELDIQNARARVLELFASVQLTEPERVARSYPHQLSGGMLQRVLIAMAISTEPALLVLDEPTSSLDVTTQAAMLDLLRSLIERHSQMAVLCITHNMGVVAEICQRVAVMYAGELVEDAPSKNLFKRSLHPYTTGLLDSIPHLGISKTQVALRTIPGHKPEVTELPSGCIFGPRCPLAIEICNESPPLYQASETHRSRCHRWDEIKRGKVSSQQSTLGMETLRPTGKSTQSKKTLLAVRDLKVHYSKQSELLERLRTSKPAPLRAVNGVSFDVNRMETLGLVGESGSGKTTIARAIVGLEKATAGEMRLLNEDILLRLERRSPDLLGRVQMVFQDPGESLNPYLTVGQTLRRAISRHRNLADDKVDGLVFNLLKTVHLPAEYAQRLPRQLSGGEKQRVAIARAFASSPDVIIADEPVSALDASVQASILNLFSEIQTKKHVGVIFISHDLAVVGYLANEIAVIYQGCLMEISPSEVLFEPPYHPYTELLLSSVPRMKPQSKQERIIVASDTVGAPSPDRGCPFHHRCQHVLGPLCAEVVPPWREIESIGKSYFCHIPPDELMGKQSLPFFYKEMDQERVE